MNTSQYTFLIVEDDPNDVALIKRAFQKAQLVNPLHVVTDGEAAIAYLAGKAPYDNRQRFPLPVVLLLDLKLPLKSGFEVLQWLRQQPKLRRLPVVILTSSSESPDINKAYDLGANSYLVKPVAMDALADMFKTLDLYWLVLNEKPDLEAN